MQQLFSPRGDARPRLAALCLAACATFLLATSAGASVFVGDLVYCDDNADGVYDPADGDTLIDGVDVNIVCTGNDGQECATRTATTGAPHGSVDPGAFGDTCGDLVDYAVPSPGRYLVEVLGVRTADGCGGLNPFSCTATVDPDTLPSDCNVLVTPVVGAVPADDVPDGNGDGDFCDPEDGPFPEGQILGDNGTDQGACENSGNPGPDTGVHSTRHVDSADSCMLYADFGYTPEDEPPPPGVTRTLGFWKNHPYVLAKFLPVSHCGDPVTEVCDAVGLLQTGGGGFDNFTRQSVAASLNCNAFGCPDEIAKLIAAGNLACGDYDFDFGAAGDKLDYFNNSGDDLPLPFPSGSADPHFCSDSDSNGNGKKNKK